MNNRQSKSGSKKSRMHKTQPKIVRGSYQKSSVVADSNPQDVVVIEQMIEDGKNDVGPIETNDHKLLAIYKSLHNQLMDEIAAGRGDGEAADIIRDKMDEPWHALSEEGRKLYGSQMPTTDIEWS